MTDGKRGCLGDALSKSPQCARQGERCTAKVEVKDEVDERLVERRAGREGFLPKC